MSDASLSPCNFSISSCSSPSEAESPPTIVLSEDLPLPTAPRPFPTKKSHARKQPLGHIPRPRNAFILFRCDYGRQNEKTTKERDQNDVSRMVGNIWRNMTDEQRAPWVVMAEAEKKRHAAMYPGYKYAPRNRKPKPTEKAVKKLIENEVQRVVEAEVAAQAADQGSKDMVTVYYPPWATRRTLTYFARRATSCPPPGAIGIEPYNETMDRSMVATSGPPCSKEAQENPEPSCARADVFVPSTYGFYDETCSTPSEALPACSSISADRLLSQSVYTVDQPGGSSWDVRAPSKYTPPQQEPGQFCGPAFYTQQGEIVMSVPGVSAYQSPRSSEPYRDQRNYDCWSPDIPALQPPSPGDTSSASSPITPTDNYTFAHSYSGMEPSLIGAEETDLPTSFNKSQSQDPSYQDFFSEFGNMFHSPSASGGSEDDAAYGAVVNIIPRESSMRTTYAPLEGNHTGNNSG